MKKNEKYFLTIIIIKIIKTIKTMGKCSISTAYVGIKILLSDLIMQINEENIELIKMMLYDGCIEDDNGLYNTAYRMIMDTELPLNYKEYQEHLLTELKNNGSFIESRFTGEVRQDFSDGCLLERVLLVPIKEILTTARWGYDRTGTNSSSRLLDFDLSVDTSKYKELKNIEIIFFITQNVV